MAIVYLPKNLNIKTLSRVFSSIQNYGKMGYRQILIDVSTAEFIDTCGMTALANVLIGFQEAGINIGIIGIEGDSPAVKFMHSSGFVNGVTNYEQLAPGMSGSTVIPFTRISGTNHVGFLHMRLKPWIAQEISLSSDTLETLCTCIAEAFMNVEHHADGVGFGMAQHYPQKKELHITVADQGIGIPSQVRRIHPNMTDTQALRKSCERGFTTKTNYVNRGFGIDNLLRYTVGSNGGAVMIRSFGGTLNANPRKNSMDPLIKTTPEQWSYPGTLVQICLRTDTLERSEDTRQEEFKW